MVSWNKTESCGTMEIDLRKLSKSTSRMSCPPIKILPLDGSKNRYKRRTKVVFLYELKKYLKHQLIN